MQIHSVTFDPPEGFTPEETMVSLRQEGSAHPGPSLIVHSKKARTGAGLEVLTGEAVAELSQSVPGLTQLTQGKITFDDGAVGVLLGYDIPATSPANVLRQYHVLRLDNGRVTALTLTVPSAGLDDAATDRYLKSLISLRAS